MALETPTEFCLICKEVARRDYKIQVTNGSDDTAIRGFICPHCWERFVSSYHNEGRFKISQFIGWARNRRDFFRS